MRDCAKKVFFYAPLVTPEPDTANTALSRILALNPGAEKGLI